MNLARGPPRAVVLNEVVFEQGGKFRLDSCFFQPALSWLMKSVWIS